MRSLFTSRAARSGARIGGVAATVVAMLAVFAPVAQAAPTDAQIRDCVLKNLPRYAVPDRAVVAQYVDVEQACRAALGGSTDVNVRITPIGGGDGPSASTDATRAPSTSGGDAGPARSDADAATPTVGGNGTDGDGTGGAAGGVGDDPARDDQGSSTADGAADTAAMVARALERDGAEVSGPVPGDVGSLPWWALLLGGGVIVTVVGVALARLRASRAGGAGS